MKLVVAAAMMFVCASSGARAASIPNAPVNKYMITAEEQSACGMDAIELCSFAYPNQDKLLACMKMNRLNLSTACRLIFDEGLARRHLN